MNLTIIGFVLSQVFWAPVFFESRPSVRRDTELEKLISDLEALRSRFDHIYFEYYQYPEYDKIATECGFGNTATFEWRKIARDGIKRYSHKISKSTPDAKIKYTSRAMTSVYDGTSCRILQGKDFLEQKEKSTSCEENVVFHALGWPESGVAGSPTRIYVPEIFRTKEGNWELFRETLNNKECIVVRSKELRMTFFFDADSKMPVRYEFLQTKEFPAQKIVLFSDYDEVSFSDLKFPKKIVVSCQLFSREGKSEGNTKGTMEISGASEKTSPDLFILTPAPGVLVTETGEKGSNSFVYYPNSQEFLKKGVDDAKSRTVPVDFENEYGIAWAAFMGGAVLVFLILTGVRTVAKKTKSKSQAVANER